MSRKRLSKKQLKSDKFVERTFDWAHWAETHRSQVVAGGIALVVLVGGLFAYRSMAAGAEERASAAYMTARQPYFAGNYPLAASDLEAFLDGYGDTSYGDEARFFRADALYRAGQVDEAVAALEAFLDRDRGSPFADNARLLLGAAYSAAGRADDAIAVYEDALDNAEYDARRIRIRELMALAYEAQGRKAEAAAQYEEILTLVPEGQLATDARRRIIELTVEPLEIETEVSAATPPASEGPERPEGT